MVICLEQGATDLHMVQLMLLPRHHLCFSKIQNDFLLVLAYPGSPDTQVVLKNGHCCC